MKKQKPLPTISTYEVERRVRRDWGAISPITRVIPNKKKNQKIKHKRKDYDYGKD